MKEYKKRHTKANKLKYQLQRETKNLNYQIGHNLSQIFWVILSMSSKSIKQ